MTEAIIVAIISLIGTFAGAFGGLRLTCYRIQQLEKKVDEHNNFARRMPVVEEKMQYLATELDDLKHNIK